LCSSLGADAHVRRRLKAISPNRVWDAPLEEGKSLGGLQALAQNLPRRSFVFVAHHAFARPDSCRHEAMRNVACRSASPSCIRRAEGMESFKATVHLQAARRINSSSKIKASKALSKATQQVSIKNGLRLGPNCARSNFAQLCKIHTCTPSREQGTGVPLACLHRGRRACSHQVQARACCQHRSAFYDCDYLPTASMCRHRPGQETRCAHNSGTRLCQIHACAYTRSTTNVMHAVASMSTSHAELRPSSLLPQARGSFS